MEQQSNPASVVQKPNILKEFPSNAKVGIKKLNIVFLSILVVLAGVITGWLLSGKGNAKSQTSGSEVLKVDKSTGEAGQIDESVEYNEADGMLVDGGIEGEGTHHLERDGGPSKYVYLTSTSIDLQSFVGKKVKVWGQTLSPIHAPWLMDVAKIKVAE